jgi:parvulin-like peptidyl-prolyl cis-trans isomerase-like protein
MKILREPLLHFVLLGAAIFAVYGFVTRHRTDKPGEIIVTQGTLENIVTGFTRTWQRPPTEEELRGLVREYIREEAAYREALAMGLDRDDTIVRRRLRQKLEFLSDDLATRIEPTDADLRTFLQAHPNLFQSEPLFSFRQVYLNPQEHAANLAADEARLLANLQRTGNNADLSSLGDPFLLAPSYQNISLAGVKQVFGDQFASALEALPTSDWQGPVTSGYGTHFVFVSQRTERSLPALADIRDQVRREWFNTKRNEATEKFYQALLKRYTVKIEPPEEKKVAQAH